MPQSLTSIVRHNPRFVSLPRRDSIMVAHSTEGHNRAGVEDLTGLAAYFRTVEADATFGVDAEGNRIRMKLDTDRPWTQTVSNDRSLSIEQVGFAAFTKREWVVSYHNGLRTVAEIFAYWSQKWNIPLEYSATHGVVSHADLPGTHTDPGDGYPFTYVIWWAKGIKAYRNGKTDIGAHYKSLVLERQHDFGLKANWGYRG